MRLMPQDLDGRLTGLNVKNGTTAVQNLTYAYMCSREKAFSVSPTESENFSSVAGLSDSARIRLISYAANA